jgi:hypothetical protein
MGELKTVASLWERDMLQLQSWTVARVNCDRQISSLSLSCGEQKSTIRRVNYWNIIADTLDSLNKARLWNPRNLSAPDKDAH